MDPVTIEKANVLRKEMGLKPLPVPGHNPKEDIDDEDKDADCVTTLEDRHAQAYDNYRKIQHADLTKLRRENMADAVKQARERAQRHTVLRGTTLGEDDGDSGGAALLWLSGQKKRQSKFDNHAQAENEFDEFTRKETRKKLFGSDGIFGVEVEHDMRIFIDAQDQILTLKDSTVLENEVEGDKLENLELREDEVRQTRFNLKKGQHDPLSIDECSYSRSILSQYDEDACGKTCKIVTFDPNEILGDVGSSGLTTQIDPSTDTVVAGAYGQYQPHCAAMEDVLVEAPSTDYINSSTINSGKLKRESKVRKIKRKNRRPGAANADVDDTLLTTLLDSEAEESVEGNTSAEKDNKMIIDDVAATKPIVLKNDGAYNEESLHTVMTVQQAQVPIKTRRMRPKGLAKILREESTQHGDGGMLNPVFSAEGGLIIDETAEFISNLSRAENQEKARKMDARISSTTIDKDNNIDSNKKAHHMQDWVHGELENGCDSLAGLEKEKKISEGMGATLAILRGRGIMESEQKCEDGHSGSTLNFRMRTHGEFVAEKKLRLAQLDDEARRRREQERATDGTLSRMSGREREEYARRQNAQREFQTSRMLQDMFSEKYTPNFQIQYVDEYGRSLNQKEAFRALSHGFHGKSSGRGKTDKMLKRIAAEKRKMTEGILDTSKSVGMSSVAQQQLKKRREAGVRLD